MLIRFGYGFQALETVKDKEDHNKFIIYFGKLLINLCTMDLLTINAYLCLFSFFIFIH